MTAFLTDEKIFVFLPGGFYSQSALLCLSIPAVSTTYYIPGIDFNDCDRGLVFKYSDELFSGRLVINSAA
ncbi:MAG: hypothetical protein IPK31_15270 [Chitinophagaceae bacterium]|nr:hypothetical protein [Chitinophagaceae bacterium]